MKKTLLVFTILTVLSSSSIGQEFQFNDSPIGIFASEWFDYINKGETSIFSYDKSNGWRDYLESLRDLSVMKQGIVPVMLSYETEFDISVYSKERYGGWVTVNLSIDKMDEIIAMGIKKSFKPNYISGYRSLSKAKINEILTNVAVLLEKKYVRPKKGLNYANWVRDQLKSGAYNHITQTDLLAKKLTYDLVDFSGDKHLELIPPTQFSEVKDRFGLNLEVEPVLTDVQENFDSFEFIGPSFSSQLSPEPELSLEAELSEVSQSFIIGKKMKNNVGYITLERFVGNEEGLREIKNTFENLRGIEKLIIDLRQSGGGDGAAAEYILAVLNGESVDFENEFQQTKLAILTSNKTISAGESLAYRVKENSRGIIVGQQTAGAGYLVDVFEVSNGFFFVNSISTSFDESNGEGWQGVGVTPNLLVPTSDALEVALENLSKD